MAKLKAKQVTGVVDTTSTQTVSGQKTFTSAQAFPGGLSSVVIYDGYLYWVNDPANLDDFGNTRVRFEGGLMRIQTFNGDWQDV
jgi:hypothetical protein